jgi:hypothetical protein
VHGSSWENERHCVTVGMLAKLEVDLNRHALTSWIKSYCGLTGVNAEDVPDMCIMEYVSICLYLYLSLSIYL